MKMYCKLCEMSLDQHKCDIISCAHSPIYVNGSAFPIHHSVGLKLRSNALLPQTRDMMIAAYLLRGERRIIN